MENMKTQSPEETQEFKPMIKFEVGMRAYFRNPVNDAVEEGEIVDIDEKTGNWTVKRNDLSVVLNIDGEKAAKINYDKSKESPTIAGVDRPQGLSLDEIDEEQREKLGELIE